MNVSLKHRRGKIAAPKVAEKETLFIDSPEDILEGWVCDEPVKRLTGYVASYGLIQMCLTRCVEPKEECKKIRVTVEAI